MTTKCDLARHLLGWRMRRPKRARGDLARAFRIVTTDCRAIGRWTIHYSIFLLERFYGRRLVLFHIEHSVKLGDLQQIVNFLGQVEQLQFAALVLRGGKGAD